MVDICFRRLAKDAGLTVGSDDIIMCTWSLSVSMTSIENLESGSRDMRVSSPLTYSSKLADSIFLRYFVTKTKWYRRRNFEWLLDLYGFMAKILPNSPLRRR